MSIHAIPITNYLQQIELKNVNESHYRVNQKESITFD